MDDGHVARGKECDIDNDAPSHVRIPRISNTPSGVHGPKQSTRTDQMRYNRTYVTSTMQNRLDE